MIKTCRQAWVRAEQEVEMSSNLIRQCVSVCPLTNQVRSVQQQVFDRWAISSFTRWRRGTRSSRRWEKWRTTEVTQYHWNFWKQFCIWIFFFVPDLKTNDFFYGFPRSRRCDMWSADYCSYNQSIVSFLRWDSLDFLIILTSVVYVSTGARQRCYWELWFPLCWDRQLSVFYLPVCFLTCLLLCFSTVLACLSSLFPVSDVFFLFLSLCLYVSLPL